MDDASDSAESFSVKRIIKHERYKESNGILINDIALIQVDKPFKFNTYIQPICIPLDLGKKVVILSQNTHFMFVI